MIRKKKNKHQIFPWLLLYLVKDHMNATRGIGKKKKKTQPQLSNSAWWFDPHTTYYVHEW